jgi:hypothetical protein
VKPAGKRSVALPLDPRKSPWKRGDLCTRRFQIAGFVVSSTPEFLEVRWKDCVERIPADEIDSVIRLGHADGPSPSGEKTNLETLLALETLEHIGMLTRNRKFKNAREKTEAENFIRRAYAPDACYWDKKNAINLTRLALEPEKVGLGFKIRERLHKVFCKNAH